MNTEFFSFAAFFIDNPRPHQSSHLVSSSRAYPKRLHLAGVPGSLNHVAPLGCAEPLIPPSPADGRLFLERHELCTGCALLASCPELPQALWGLRFRADQNLPLKPALVCV